MKIVSPDICSAAIGPWLALWESEFYDLLDDYQFNPVPLRESSRVGALIVADLVPWLRRWPVDALERLSTALEYYLSYDPVALGDLASRDTGFSTADPIAAVWMPIWSALFDRNLAPAMQEHYAIESGSSGSFETTGLELPPVTWGFDEEVMARQLESSFSARIGFLTVASIEEAKQGAVGLRSFDLSLQGLRSINHAFARYEQDPTIRWTPDIGAGILSPVGGAAVGLEIYATERAIERDQRSSTRRSYNVDALELLLDRLMKSACVMGLAADTPESLVAESAAMASRTDSPYKQWETLGRLATSILEAIEGDHVIVRRV